jgi:adhesin transport system outer membrane protein
LKKFALLFLASWLYGDMNFEDLISKAVNHHPSIQMSQEAFKMSEEELNSAKWQYFPTPSVDYSNSSKNNEVVAKLEQPLWTGGKLDSQYDIALSSKAEAGYTLEESKYRLVERILNLLQAYSQGKSAEISLKEGYDRLSEFTVMIDKRIEAGISSQSDEVLLNSRLIQIKSDLINAKSKKTLALKQLSLLVGENIESVNFNLDKFNFDNTQSSVLIDDMVKFHPTLKKMDEQLKGSIHQVSKEESALYPTLSLIAEHKQGDVYTENNNTSDNAVYLSLKATTGAGLSLFSNVEKAKLNTKRLKSEKDSKQQELTDSFIIDYNNMMLAKEKLANLKLNQEFSNEVFESNKRLFIAGKKQWLDLVNSSKELMDISVSYRDTKELYNILKYKIALQTGRINLEGLSSNDNEINIKPAQFIEQKPTLIQEKLPIKEQKNLVVVEESKVPKEVNIPKNNQNTLVEPIKILTLKSDVGFPLGSSYLTAQGKEELARYAKELIEQSKTLKQIEIIGHTDRIGNKEFNDWLSQRRAQRVADYLKTFGVNLPMAIIGKGSSQPTNTNCTEQSENISDCLSVDRRVEIKVY